jgi:hypothetical protein
MAGKAIHNVRSRDKAQREYYGRDELQQCIVCGRLFVQRKDNTYRWDPFPISGVCTPLAH